MAIQIYSPYRGAPPDVMAAVKAGLDAQLAREHMMVQEARARQEAARQERESQRQAEQAQRRQTLEESKFKFQTDQMAEYGPEWYKTMTPVWNGEVQRRYDESRIARLLPGGPEDLKDAAQRDADAARAEQYRAGARLLEAKTERPEAFMRPASQSLTAMERRIQLGANEDAKKTSKRLPFPEAEARLQGSPPATGAGGEPALPALNVANSAVMPGDSAGPLASLLPENPNMSGDGWQTAPPGVMPPAPGAPAPSQAPVKEGYYESKSKEAANAATLKKDRELEGYEKAAAKALVEYSRVKAMNPDAPEGEAVKNAESYYVSAANRLEEARKRHGVASPAPPTLTPSGFAADAVSRAAAALPKATPSAAPSSLPTGQLRSASGKSDAAKRYF